MPKPVMGLWTALAMVMGCMIGSGVLLLPASLAPYGWNSVFAWLIAIAGCMALAAAFGVLTRAFPKARGPHIFVNEAFGPFAGFITVWAFWTTYWIGSAAIVIAAVSYLSRLVPALAAPGISVFASIAICWLLIIMNMLSVAFAGRVQLVSMLVKIVPLLAVFVLAAMVLTRPQGLGVIRPFRAEDIHMSSISASVSWVIWAMVGFESASVVAEKVRDPGRNVARATVYGTGAAGLIYLFVCSAVVLMLPPAETAHSAAPFGDFVGRYWGVNAGQIVSGFGAICALGALNGSIIVQGDMPAAMANDGLFPRWLAVRGRNGSALRGHLVAGVLMTGILLLNTSQTLAKIFGTLILLTTAIELFAYFMVAAAALWLIRVHRVSGTVLMLTVIGLGAVFAAYAMVAAGLEADFWGVILLLAGVPIFLGMRHSHK